MGGGVADIEVAAVKPVRPGKGGLLAEIFKRFAWKPSDITREAQRVRSRIGDDPRQHFDAPCENERICFLLRRRFPFDSSAREPGIGVDDLDPRTPVFRRLSARLFTLGKTPADDAEAAAPVLG